MNWTGGNLQRFSNKGKGTTNALNKIQKEHFARQRLRLQNGTTAPPLKFGPFGIRDSFIDFSAENASPKPKDHPSKYAAKQTTLKDYESTAGVANRLANMHRRSPRNLSKKGDAMRPLSFQRSKSRHDGHLSRPEPKFSFLGKDNWVGISTTKPVEINFQSANERDQIGKRRKVTKQDLARKLAPARPRYEPSLDNRFNGKNWRHEDPNILDDISIQIGRPGLKSQDSPGPDPRLGTQFSSDSMLLDNKATVFEVLTPRHIAAEKMLTPHFQPSTGALPLGATSPALDTTPYNTGTPPLPPLRRTLQSSSPIRAATRAPRMAPRQRNLQTKPTARRQNGFVISDRRPPEKVIPQPVLNVVAAGNCTLPEQVTEEDEPWMRFVFGDDFDKSFGQPKIDTDLAAEAPLLECPALKTTRMSDTNAMMPTSANPQIDLKADRFLISERADSSLLTEPNPVCSPNLVSRSADQAPGTSRSIYSNESLRGSNVPSPSRPTTVRSAFSVKSAKGTLHSSPERFVDSQFDGNPPKPIPASSQSGGVVESQKQITSPDHLLLGIPGHMHLRRLQVSNLHTGDSQRVVFSRPQPFVGKFTVGKSQTTQVPLHIGRNSTKEAGGRERTTKTGRRNAQFKIPPLFRSAFPLSEDDIESISDA